MNAPESKLTDAQMAELMDIAQRGGKIEAIKRYREMTGADLASAKDAIESLTEAPPVLNPSIKGHSTNAHGHRSLSDSQKAEILEMLRQGSKIAAIKKYRESLPGTELMDARKAVEQLAGEYGIKIKESCFVASAVFENSEAPTVCAMRTWRDEHLALFPGGRLLIRVYERMGPWISVAPRHSPVLRAILKSVFTRIFRTEKTQ